MTYLIFFYIYLLTYIFDGLLRYYIHNLGHPEIIYLRDLFLIFGIIIFFLTTKRYKTKFILKIVTVVFIWFLIGYFNLGLLQALFGVKIIIPLIFGIILYNSIFNKKYDEINKRIFLILLVVVYLGIYLDFIGLSFWEGYNYILGDFQIEANRDWSYFGFNRLSGFARVSFDASIQIVFLTVSLIYYIKSRLFSIIIFLISLFFIFLTTTKGALLALFFLGLLLLIFDFRKNYKVLSVFVFLLLISPILLYLSISLLEWLLSYSYETMIFFASLYARMDYTWTESFKLLDNNFYYLIFGRGLGGIGTAQKYFETYFYNPGDNLVIYLIIQFGVIFTFISVIYLSKLLKRLSTLSNLTPYYLLIIITFYGVISNTFENPLLAISLGLILAAANSDEYYLMKSKNRLSMQNNK